MPCNRECRRFTALIIGGIAIALSDPIVRLYRS
jgi:hypothetical protein